MATDEVLLHMGTEGPIPTGRIGDSQCGEATGDPVVFWTDGRERLWGGRMEISTWPLGQS